MRLTFTIRGNPRPLARARTVTKGGRTWSYTPDTSADWKQAIVLQLRSQKPKGFQVITEPLMVRLSFRLATNKEIQKAVLRQKPLDKWTFHSKKPDIDNYVKAVLDACNGVLWKDDAQIWHLTAIKNYAFDGDTGVSITIQTPEKAEG